jgi:hypothetical protein
MNRAALMSGALAMIRAARRWALSGIPVVQQRFGRVQFLSQLGDVAQRHLREPVAGDRRSQFGRVETEDDVVEQEKHRNLARAWRRWRGTRWRRCVILPRRAFVQV